MPDTNTKNGRRSWFAKFANATSMHAGHPTTFLCALLVIVVWAISGPIFKFSDTWQLVINTGTTIVTFLMVFLIQNTQNRDARAVQIKLDELIVATRGARNALLDIENLEEKDLCQLRDEFEVLAEKARKKLEARGANGKRKAVDPTPSGT